MKDLVDQETAGDTEVKLSLRVRRYDNGDMNLISSELLSDNWTNRITFHNPRCISDILNCNLEKEISAMLEKIGRNKGLISIPDYNLKFNGVEVGQLHLLVSEADNGFQNFTFRFMRFIGSIDKIMDVKFFLESPQEQNNLDLLTEVVTEIAMPLVDVLTYLEIADRPDYMLAIDCLSAHSTEIRFRSELLKRFICHHDKSRCGVSAALSR